MEFDGFEENKIKVPTKKNEQNQKTAAKEANKKMGRPKKYKEKLDVYINMGFTHEQIDLIDKRAKETGTTVRLDYIRKLIANDIIGFSE